MCNRITGNRNIPICKQTAFGWFKTKGIMNDLFMKCPRVFFITYISTSEQQLLYFKRYIIII